MQKPRPLEDEIVNSVKIVLLTILFSFALSSCAFIPASSSPEINEDLKRVVQSKEIQDGYNRTYVCMGEATIHMPANLVFKSLTRPIINSKIKFITGQNIIGSINSNEAAVFDYRETIKLTYEWSLQAIDEGGMISRDDLVLDHKHAWMHLAINSLQTAYMGKRSSSIYVFDKNGKIISSVPFYDQSMRNESIHSFSNSACNRKKIVLYKKFF